MQNYAKSMYEDIVYSSVFIVRSIIVWNIGVFESLGSQWQNSHELDSRNSSF